MYKTSTIKTNFATVEKTRRAPVNGEELDLRTRSSLLKHSCKLWVSLRICLQVKRLVKPALLFTRLFAVKPGAF